MSAVATGTQPAKQGAADTRFQAHRTVWDGIAASPQFLRLTAAKKAFIIPAVVFFFACCLALPILDGYAPNFMSAKIVGPLSRAYALALSLFLVTWGIAWRYVKAADKFDRLAKDIVAQAEEQRGGK